jgi:uncharacterized membrane protein YhaH (DUF805 family)
MDTQQAQNVSSVIAGMAGIFMIIGLAVVAFVIFLFWRIFTKAGMSGAMSLIILVPGVGGLIVLCILAFGEWKTAPVAYLAAPPVYPPVS